MTDWYWNTEDDSEIICPYCGEKTETIDGEMTEEEWEHNYG